MTTSPGSVLGTLAIVALAAASMTSGLHHLPGLGGHTVELVAVTVGGAVVASLLVARWARPVRVVARVLVARPGSPTVRPARAEELDPLAAVHREALGHGFLVGLGPRFLHGYHATFRDSPHAVALVATVDRDYPVGWLIGALDPAAHTRWTLQHRGMRLALLGVGALLVRPRLALLFARTRLQRYAGAWRRHRAGSSETPAPTPVAKKVAVLNLVVVLEGARGHGCGERLVAAFAASAADAGCDEAMLETLADDRGAGRFYARLGWRRTGRRATPDKTEMEIWTLALPQAEKTP